MAKYYCNHSPDCEVKDCDKYTEDSSYYKENPEKEYICLKRKIKYKLVTEFEYLVRKTLKEKEVENDIQRTLRRKESSKKIDENY